MSAFVRSLTCVTRNAIYWKMSAELCKCTSINQTLTRLPCLNAAWHQWTNQHPPLISRYISTRQESSSLPSKTLTNQSDVLSAVGDDSNQGRMFAVVLISGAQYKVTTGDLVLLHNHIQCDVGDRIRLEKVLLLGGDNFTLIGKPVLSLDTVRIEATVIEKTLSQKKVNFLFKRRKRVAKYKEFSTPQTVLRINSIEAQLR